MKSVRIVQQVSVLRCPVTGRQIYATTTTTTNTTDQTRGNLWIPEVKTIFIFLVLTSKPSTNKLLYHRSLITFSILVFTVFASHSATCFEIYSGCLRLSRSVASLWGAPRPGCHQFGKTPFYDTKQKRKQQYVSCHWKCLAHWNGQKNYLKYLLKHLFRGWRAQQFVKNITYKSVKY